MSEKTFQIYIEYKGSPMKNSGHDKRFTVNSMQALFRVFDDFDKGKYGHPEAYNLWVDGALLQDLPHVA